MLSKHAQEVRGSFFVDLKINWCEQNAHIFHVPGVSSLVQFVTPRTNKTWFQGFHDTSFCEGRTDVTHMVRDSMTAHAFILTPCHIKLLSLQSGQEILTDNKPHKRHLTMAV